MLDDDFKVYLIEANTNPCLTTPCPLLTRIISNLLDSTFRIALDPLFHPHDFSQAKRSNANDILNEIKYYLVFDERIDGPFLNELMQKNQQAKIEIDDDDPIDEKGESDEEGEENQS